MSLTISVITANYNGADTLAETLDSVRSQTWRQLEHIIIDGGSTDGSLEMLQSRQEQLTVLVSERDAGIYEALNKGLARATGEVAGFLHSDDVYAYDEVLEEVATAFADPAVMAVYGDLDYVAKKDGSRIIRRWRSGEYSRRKLGLGWMPPHPTFYVRRSVYTQWGGYDTSYKIAADYELILRLLARAELQPVYIPKVMVKMRVGGESNSSLRRILRKSYEDYLTLRRHEVGGVGALCWKNLSKLGQFL